MHLAAQASQQAQAKAAQEARGAPSAQVGAQAWPPAKAMAPQPPGGSQAMAPSQGVLEHTMGLLGTAYAQLEAWARHQLTQGALEMNYPADGLDAYHALASLEASYELHGALAQISKLVRMLPQEAGKPAQRRSPQEAEELALAGAQQALKKIAELVRAPADFGRRVMMEIGLAVIDAIFECAPPAFTQRVWAMLEDPQGQLGMRSKVDLLLGLLRYELVSPMELDGLLAASGMEEETELEMGATVLYQCAQTGCCAVADYPQTLTTLKKASSAPVGTLTPELRSLVDRVLEV